MKYLGYILLSILVASCAQIRTPSGGEKDTTGPVIIESYPAHKQTNYKAKSIAVTFDELVSLKSPKNNIIISPPLLTDPEIYLKGGNTLIISFNDTLESNTTYTLNMVEAIADYNEGNPLVDEFIVFSTGDKIDSLKYAGSVMQSEISAPCVDCKVMLYKNMEDSVIYKDKPYYFTKTDENGNYEFEFLKEGAYKIAALLDANANFLYDELEDEIAFSDTTVILTNDTTVVDSLRSTLFTFKKKPDELLLESFKMKGDQKLDLVFNKAADSISIWKDSLIMLEDDYFLLWNEDKDSAEVWFNNPGVKNDNWKLSIRRNEEILEKISLFLKGDSVEFKLINPTPNASGKHQSTEIINYRWSNPISLIEKEGITVQMDSAQIEFTLDSINPLTYQLNFERNYGENFIVLIDSAAVKDIYGQVNDSITYGIQSVDTTFFGKLSVKITPKDVSQIISIKNETGTVVRESVIDETGMVNFKNLLPGIYTIWILEDRNKNSIWDAGDYLKKIHPEKIIKHKDPIEIRSNWELEIEVRD